MRRRPIATPAFACFAILIALAVAPAAGRSRVARPDYPSAPRLGLTEDFHGLAVSDPYRWLEDLRSPQTSAWIAAQDALTRSRLSDATFERFRGRLDALMSIEAIGAPVARGDRLFYLHTPARENRPSLLLRVGEQGTPLTLVAADSLAEGENLTGFWPSHDGRTVAYGVGRVGSSWYRVRWLGIDGPSADGGELRGMHGSAGAPAWAADDSGVYYGRFDEPAAGAEQSTVLAGHELRFHRLGASASDDRTVYRRDDRPELRLSARPTLDGRYVVITASPGAAPGNEVHVLQLAGAEPATKIRPLVTDPEAVFAYLHNEGDRFLFRTTRGAPRGRVVRIALDDPAEPRWRDVLPQQADALYFANVVAGRLIVVWVRDARHVVEIFRLDGTREREVPLPDLGTTFSGFLGRIKDRHAYFSFNSLAYPGSASVFRLDPATGETRPFLQPALPFAPGDFVTRQVFYRSPDGTRVPMFVAHRRDLRLDGRAPVFLYAYGAFAWAATPWFQPQVLAWLEAGGVYALANVRGGGEYGEEWYRAGIGRNRQNAIDDYLAAAEWLVANGYSARGRVVGNGGSASGPLAATAMVQRPDLFGAMVIDIPVLDLLRFDRFTGGGRWKSELGDPADPSAARLLNAQSPYHNLRDGGCYPPTLVTAGERDETAVPSHAYKFVAALQHAQGCDAAVLMQVVWGGGHGFGADREQSAETYARQLAFLWPLLQVEGGPLQGGAVGSPR
jgi:prolyl oligopeptidase